MRHGYTPVHTPGGKLWVPANYPGFERFVPRRSGEALPEPVEVPPHEPLSAEQAAKNMRDMQERIAALEAMMKGAKK
jgi:hypothetical protein